MRLFYAIIHQGYRIAVKPVLFMMDPETVHRRVTEIGQWLGRSRIARWKFACLFRRKYPSLVSTVAGVAFDTPIGLAAGFDYEARLPQILPSLGFGFGTVGTLTHRPYGGNPGPMLGRLPQSRSLMVNKGFKNDGVGPTLARWQGTTFAYPVGVSIGKTNDPTIATQADAVADVVAGFRDAEASGVAFAYYELNISCPNLAGSVEFYAPEHLDGLLTAISVLRLSRPIFIKMPISKTDQEIEAMLDVIVQHSIAGVIFGNLQRDRHHPALVPQEVQRFSVGNFSGAPCRERSDELIGLAYRRAGQRLAIIGCGGVFSAQDAYRKIRLGASLVQLITGLIFEGPQLVAQINHELARLLARDGYQMITQARGIAQ